MSEITNASLCKEAEAFRVSILKSSLGNQERQALEGAYRYAQEMELVQAKHKYSDECLREMVVYLNRTRGNKCCLMELSEMNLSLFEALRIKYLKENPGVSNESRQLAFLAMQGKGSPRKLLQQAAA